MRPGALRRRESRPATRDDERDAAERERDDRERRRAAAAERRHGLDDRRGRVGRLGPRPVDDRAVGVRLPHGERVGAASASSARGTRSPRLARRHRAAAPRHLRDRRRTRPCPSAERRASSPAPGRTSRSRSPSARVSSTVVVVAPSFSVGTASVKTWPLFASTTGGLTFACANAAAATTSAASATSANAAIRVSSCSLLRRNGRIGPRAARPACVTRRRGEAARVRRAGGERRGWRQRSAGTRSGDDAATGAPRRRRGERAPDVHGCAQEQARGEPREQCERQLQRAGRERTSARQRRATRTCPACSERSRNSWIDERGGREQAEAPTAERARGAPRAASTPATSSETSATRPRAPNTSGSRSRYPCPVLEQVRAAERAPRIDEPVRERVRCLRAREHSGSATNQVRPRLIDEDSCQRRRVERPRRRSSMLCGGRLPARASLGRRRRAGSSVGAIVRGAAWRSRWARIAAFISSRWDCSAIACTS